jgi:hypothetical protein
MKVVGLKPVGSAGQKLTVVEVKFVGVANQKMN